MLSKVHIFCFVACYSVALLLEVSRLWFRSAVRGYIRLGFVAAGWVAHTAFLYYSVMEPNGSLLSSYRDWLLVAAWVMTLVYVYMAIYHRTTHFGVFLLPTVLGLIGAARWLADPRPFSRGPASMVWGVIHGTSILLATVAVLVGFVAGLMYLRQAGRLKSKRPGQAKLKLPSLEWLQTVNSRAIVASMLLVGISVFSGFVLNLINARRNAPAVPWYDPIVLGTLTMFGWLVLHVVISAIYRPLRHGRKVAYLTLVSFVFLLIALAMGLMMKSKHGGEKVGMRIPNYGTFGSPRHGERA